jgi:rhodanese-related sulfurtransferase
MKPFIPLITILLLTGAPVLSNVCEGDVCPLPVAGEKPAVITTAELEQLVQSGKVVLIETRPGVTVGLPGAKLLSGTPTAEEAAAVIPAKDSLVVTYCANINCFSSENMAKHLKSLGYTNVREYPQGLAGWRRAGHPVEPIRQ